VVVGSASVRSFRLSTGRHPTRPGLLRKQQTLLASLVGAVAARVMMAAFLVYQKWRYDSVTPRDAHIESGMESGLQDALDLLEQVAMSLR
jgi:hypothetical protein